MNTIDNELSISNLHIVSLSQANKKLKSKSDISNCLFENLEIKGFSAKQSLFPGVIFRRCKIYNCDFSRSDFEGARFEDCELVNVNFENTDIRSTLFGRCMISQCNYSGAFISDIVFQETKVLDAIFDGASLLKSKFINSYLENLSNSQCTMLHNDFNRSILTNIKFGDCTALYSYFEGCEFNNFSINIDSLGLSYGISEEDVENINFIFLGSEEKKPENFSIYEHVVKQFEIRKWLLQTKISILNFNLLAPLNAWINIFESLRFQISSESGAKMDDIIFIVNIMNQMRSKNKLPFLSIVFCREILNELNLFFSTKDDVHSQDIIKKLEIEVHNIFLLMNENIMTIISDVQYHTRSSSINCQLILLQKPNIDIERHLVFLLKSSGFDIKNDDLIFSPAFDGSWVKPFKTSAQCLSMMLICLYLAEGCLIKITSIRARTEVLTSSSLPVDYLQEASNPKQYIPPEIAEGMKFIYKNNFKELLSKNKAKNGITQENIKQITIN